MTTASSTDYKRKLPFALSQKRFQVALGIFSDSERNEDTLGSIHKKNKRSCDPDSVR